jgi:hypothetical protein
MARLSIIPLFLALSLCLNVGYSQSGTEYGTDGDALIDQICVTQGNQWDELRNCAHKTIVYDYILGLARVNELTLVDCGNIGQVCGISDDDNFESFKSWMDAITVDLEAESWQTQIDDDKETIYYRSYNMDGKTGFTVYYLPMLRQGYVAIALN